MPDPADDLDSIPLHDRARHAEKLARELITQLETEYLPRVKELQEMIAPNAMRPAGDLSVREGVRKVFLADETVDGTWQRTHAHLESIARGLERLAEEDAV